MKVYNCGVFLINGKDIVPEDNAEKVQKLSVRAAGSSAGKDGGACACGGTGASSLRESARQGTIACRIMKAHNRSGDMEHLKIAFDAAISHDNACVGIVRKAIASGVTKFPLPFFLTGCPDSSCAAGAADDDSRLFGLSAAKKHGGIFVPPGIGVIQQYIWENFAGCGKMILGSGRRSPCGALGTMAFGGNSGELVKQLLQDTFGVDRPGVTAIYMTGRPAPYVGPQDVALAVIRAVSGIGCARNRVMEFVGPGVSSMTTDYRSCVDVMSAETDCLSSIWCTDGDTKAFLEKHGRGSDYRELNPAETAYYDGCVYVDLSDIHPMIALPFHPSNAYEIGELYGDLDEILTETEELAAKLGKGRPAFTLRDKFVNGRLQARQGVIAGAGGSYTSIAEVAHALKGRNCSGGEFCLSVCPSSQPVFADLEKKGLLADLADAGVVIQEPFRGAGFGAEETPAENILSIRHTEGFYPDCEGAGPGQTLMPAVALMDARSIAATAANGGRLTSAEDFDGRWGDIPEYDYDDRIYRSRVYNGFDQRAAGRAV